MPVFLALIQIHRRNCMKTISLKINGMHCKSCEMLITDAVQDIKGVKEVKVSPGAAKVSFDESVTSEDAIKTTIAQEGYTVI